MSVDRDTFYNGETGMTERIVDTAPDRLRKAVEAVLEDAELIDGELYGYLIGANAHRELRAAYEEAS